MQGVERFEDLIAWQKARVLTREVNKTTKKGQFVQDYRLASQLQSASVSIMSNIAEGFERGSMAEFHHFLQISKGSCAEVRSKLYVSLDIEYLAATEFERLMEMAKEVGRIIGGLRSSVERAKREFK